MATAFILLLLLGTLKAHVNDLPNSVLLYEGIIDSPPAFPLEKICVKAKCRGKYFDTFIDETSRICPINAQTFIFGVSKHQNDSSVGCSVEMFVANRTEAVLRHDFQIGQKREKMILCSRLLLVSYFLNNHPVLILFFPGSENIMPHLRKIFNLTKALINESPKVILRSYGKVYDIEEMFIKAKYILEQLLSSLEDISQTSYEKILRWYKRCSGGLFLRNELPIEGLLDDCLPFVHEFSAMTKYQIGMASLIAISLLVILWSIACGRHSIVFSHCVLIDHAGRQSHSWNVSTREIQVTMREVYNLLRRPQIKAVVLSRRYGGMKGEKHR